MYAEIVAILVLTALSIHDVKTRELPDKLVYASLAIIVFLRIAEYWVVGFNTILPLWFYIVVDIVLLGMTAVIAWLGYFGWGDVAVLALITVASPIAEGQCIIMPPLLMVIIYYVLLTMILMVANMLVNITAHRRDLARLPAKYRLIYAFIARPIRARKLSQNPGWWYPLNLCGKYSVRFNIYVDPPDIAKEVSLAIQRGCVKPNDKVWATYGVPGIPLFTVAYILTLILGDGLLLSVLGLSILMTS